MRLKIERLEERRKELGLSLAAMSKRLGLTKDTLHSYEMGKYCPKVNMLDRLARGYELQVTDLIDFGTDKIAPDGMIMVNRRQLFIMLNDRAMLKKEISLLKDQIKHLEKMNEFFEHAPQFFSFLASK